MSQIYTYWWIILVVIFSVGGVHGVEPLIITKPRTSDEMQFQEIRSLDDLQLEHIDNNIIYKVMETNTILIHCSKLNTAARVSGLSSFQNTKGDNWAEFAQSSAQSVLGTRIPVTGCLDNTHGDGGTLGGSFSKSFGKSAELDLSLGFSTGAALTPTLGWDITVGTLFSVNSGYSCTVAANTTGQVFVQPFYTTIEGARYRYLHVEEKRFRIRKTVKYFEAEDWKTDVHITFPSPFRKPLVVCVTDPRLLECIL